MSSVIQRSLAGSLATFLTPTFLTAALPITALPITAWVVLTLVMATDSQADVIINDSRNDYAITADTPMALSRALQRANHHTEQGLIEVALTSSRLSAQMRAQGHEAGCRIDSVTITADIEIRMPQLQTRSRYLQAQWNAYFPRLLEHELQHRAITLDQAYRIEQAILALPDQNQCDEIMADATYTFNQLKDDGQRQQVLFDEAEYASGHLDLKHFFTPEPNVVH